MLNDGRLVSGSEGGKIIIHNKITYKPDLIITNKYNKVRSLMTLKSGVLAACDEYYINFYNIKENKYEKLSIIDNNSRGYKLLELQNNYLVSIDYNALTFFFIDNLKYEKDFTNNGEYNSYSLIQTTSNEICYYEYKNRKDNLCFFDLNERKVKSSIENIDGCGSYGPFSMIKNNLLITSGKNKIYVIL